MFCAMSKYGIVVLVLFHAFQHAVSCLKDISYKCTNEEQCVRVYGNTKSASESHVFSTLSNCRLLCGKYGPLWPRPTGHVTLGKETTVVNPLNLRFEQDFINQTTEGTTILREIKMYFLRNLRKAFQTQILHESTPGMPIIIKIQITSNETNLSWYVDESYKLKISIENLTTVVTTIEAKTIFGTRHGFETLLQLFTTVNSSVNILSQANIIDQPIYAHRGLLIDTARNYIPIKCLKRQIDAMAASKFNVFHWHITDTQSFPMQFDTVPEMVFYGAYSKEEVYSQNDIKSIIKYAKYRGIRVILELDAPAHAGNGWQWGPEKDLGNLAVCVNQKPWRNFCIEPPCGQLNPINPNLYTVLQQIYKDIAEMNKEESVIHMGGDEVFFGCWNATAEIINYLMDHNLGRTEQDFLTMWSKFQKKVLNLWDNARRANGSAYSASTNEHSSPVILWSSRLTDPLVIDKFLSKNRYVIQTWLPSSSTIPKELQKLGYKLIVSTKDAWYLDHGFWGVTTYYTWKKVYDNQLPKGNGILGGEVCVWTEYIDEYSIDGRTWPRAAAAAERLWSNPETKAIDAESRFFCHRERLIIRGIQPEALAPRWCEQNEKQCH
ncbi:chitooligosaccharidolytic beta-N-acetylglucosaminidase isoform X1 [Anopheles gambiae]|uniref:beta-N-acetylhexosaminidase n=3 Tax=gambiae species complex TaxID=44542 RepID=A0A6E8W593_ANOCL|nr:chitooligosaccharidolytic beta-N-acetylglucosaminidase isoform X1 [Anopheles coluzzii]XP_061506877.1 chitooligosaccharidolytic beta-N-acetylglucosaminidase isoform X1 [Anopheles gambiae]XP_061506878.1 chitooligosaccharidolytic beta-N-acetylglucosaminidase isoform X1 [Anopheles gambiae]